MQLLQQPQSLHTAKVATKDGRLHVSLPRGFEIAGFIFKDKLTGLTRLLGRGRPEPVLGFDPSVIGYDRKVYSTGKDGILGAVEYQPSALTFAASAAASIQLTNGIFVTEILIQADHTTQGDGTNIATIVEDAQDKLLQALSIVGQKTYYAHSDSKTYMKVLGNLCKQIYPGLPRQDISTSSAASDHIAYQAWKLHFGALNDRNPFDITAGIKAQANLNMNVTFSAANVQAATAAHNILQTTTKVYVVVIGVSGLPKAYMDNAPYPDFRTDIYAAPTTTTNINLLGGRFLKRSTILSQAVAASNNNPRSDSNLSTFAVKMSLQGTRKFLDSARWNTAKAFFAGMEARAGAVDPNGLVAVMSNGLTGVLTIDWRKLTGNIYGLDLLDAQDNQVQYEIGVGTTTGQLSALHEYYDGSDIAKASMRAWQDSAFQPV